MVAYDGAEPKPASAWYAREPPTLCPHTEADYAWSRPHGLIEKPGMYPGEAEAWLYCNKFSYMQDEKVSLHVHTTAEHFDIEVFRDGGRCRSVLKMTGLKGRTCPTPDDAYATGCGWPEACKIDLAQGEWESAFYVVVIRIEEFHGLSAGARGLLHCQADAGAETAGRLRAHP